MQGEISYDMVMEDDMGFVEGTYRLGRGDWQVFIFTRLTRKQIEQPRWEVAVWDSGATGNVFFVPRSFRLNMASVETLMSEALCCERWKRVKGPDSMQLR
jgi:hypothetical protein